MVFVAGIDCDLADRDWAVSAAPSTEVIRNLTHLEIAVLSELDLRSCFAGSELRLQWSVRYVYQCPKFG